MLCTIRQTKTWTDDKQLVLLSFSSSQTGLLPIVPVLKSHGGVRICADNKISINHLVKLDMWALPRTEDLYAILSGGKNFH